MNKVPSAKAVWEAKLIEKVAPHHPRSAEKVAKKLLTRASSVKSSMVTRSKEFSVECGITLEDIREMIYDHYGTPCRYSGRVLTIKNMVFDHIVPVSKGGSSNRDNIQVISKFSNNMKGSLSGEHFEMLLAWLQTVPSELATDVSIRLAHGIR